ncbi:hypothetical protein DYB36_005707 [Aphanomyces astaci]|nr:hypothetical protein DYB36_005707 [Aphanomyces astaci]
MKLTSSLTILPLLATVHGYIRTHKPVIDEETKTLAQLYQEAIQEGGNLVVYHGGDTPDQQNYTADAFKAKFPDINLTMIVDYSKYHNARVDNQLETNSLVADVIALQTLQDYPRWKKEDKLLAYKPKGFSGIYDGFKDADGTWYSHAVFTFSYFYDTAILEGKGIDVPKTAKDLADPKYKGLIASSWPHDDDASLFVYDRYVKEYGWDWVKKLAENNVQFNRGSHTAGEAVANKTHAIGVAGSVPEVNTPTVVEPTGDGAGSDYLSWGQRIAVLKKAPHPAAAKLFVNWIVSKEVQNTVMKGFSSRTDIEGASKAWDVKRANSLAFQKWMENRAYIEELKATFALYFKEVTGEPSPGQLGLHPGK